MGKCKTSVASATDHVFFLGKGMSFIQLERICVNGLLMEQITCQCLAQTSNGNHAHERVW